MASLREQKLTAMPPGSRAVVANILAGPGLKSRLMQMGIVPGEVVEVVSNGPGPILVRIRGVVIALGRGVADKITVHPYKEDSSL